MESVLALVLFTIFILLSALHFYWAFNGKRGAALTIPAKSDNIPLFKPGKWATLIVALGLFCFGLIALLAAGLIHFPYSSRIGKVGLWMIAGLFFARAIGEFKYVGFFKKIRNTQFAKNDSTYYSPLSLAISVLAIGLLLC